MIIVADTSGIIAASDRNARESAACRKILREAGTVIISPLVLAEVDHLAKARFGSAARTAIIDFIIAQARELRFEIPQTGTEILGTARVVQRRYAGLDLDLADVVNVVLADTATQRPAVTGQLCQASGYRLHSRRSVKESEH